MEPITEIYRRRRRDDEIKPFTAAADDPDFSPEQAAAMVKDFFADAGTARVRELEAAPLKDNRDGTYLIPYTSKGGYSDFINIANYDYLKKKYPWLHSVGDSCLGIDVDDAIEGHGSLEAFLRQLPHESWTEFLEDMDNLDAYPSLDDDRASELEMEECDRWITEDATPELIRSLMEVSDNAYESYLFAKITPQLVHEWCRETENYPEADGEGGVWLNMREFAEERDTQTWFIDNIEDDVAGWNALKRKFYDEKGAERFNQMLQHWAGLDEHIAHAYNQSDSVILYEWFLKAFQDERPEPEAPTWYLNKPSYYSKGEWVAGYSSDEYDPKQWVPPWESRYSDALDYLQTADWFKKIVAGWHRRPPKNHPEFKFEAVEEDPVDPSLDSPEMVTKGGVAETVVYEDEFIRAVEPRSVDAANYHLQRAGLQPLSQNIWDAHYGSGARRYIVLLGKEEDMLPDVPAKPIELATVRGDYSGFVVASARTGSTKLRELFALERYGKSIQKALIRLCREEVSRDADWGTALLQVGGTAELRRAARRGEINIDNFRLVIALQYAKRRQLALAAKTLGRDPATMDDKGIWLVFDDITELSKLFRNYEAAESALSCETFDWFSGTSFDPDISEVVSFLTPKAMAHIREVLVNRRIWFPDEGKDKRGDYVITSKEFLNQFSDADLLRWICNPASEDEEDGVFEDIIDALKASGERMLEQAAQDNVYTTYKKEAVDALGGTTSEFEKFPSKRKNASSFCVYVNWSDVEEWAFKYNEDTGYPWEDTSIESLALSVLADTINMERHDFYPSWSDVNKEWAADCFDPVFELKVPKPPYGHPNYDDPDQQKLPIGESNEELDAPENMDIAKSTIPDKLERNVTAAIKDALSDRGITLQDIQFEYKATDHAEGQLVKMSGGSDRQPYVLLIHFSPIVATGDDYDAMCDWWDVLFKKVESVVGWAYAPYGKVIGQGYIKEPEPAKPGYTTFFFLLYKVEPPMQGPDEQVPF